MSRPRARMGDADMFEVHDAKVEARRAAVEARHDLMELEKGKGSAFSIERGRMADLHNLIRFRHRGPVETDDGPLYLDVAVPSLVERAGGFGSAKHPTKAIDSIKKWAARFTPRVTEAEVREAIREARSRSRDQMLYLNATEAGNLLELEVGERQALGIKTMRPAGMDEWGFAFFQREEATRRQQDYRIRNGATPRCDSKLARIRRLGAQLGISVSNVKRRIANGELILPEPKSVREPVSLRLDPLEERSSDRLTTKQGQHPRRALAGAGGQAVHERRAEVDPTLPARVQRDSPAPDEAAALAGIRPGGKTKLPAASRTVAVALPDGGCEIPRDLLTDLGHAETATCAIAAPTPARAVIEWTSGKIPIEVIAMIEAKAIALGLTTRSAVARSIGIERPTWSNAARREFGLGADKVALVKAWLIAA